MSANIREQLSTFYLDYFGLDKDDKDLQIVVKRLVNFTSTFLKSEFNVDLDTLSEQQIECILPTLAEFMNLVYQGHPLFNDSYGIVKEKLGNWELQYSTTFSKDKLKMLKDLLKNGLTSCNIYKQPSRVVRTYNSCGGCCCETNPR